MLVSSSPSSQFFTLKPGADLQQPMQQGSSCDLFDLGDALWLPKDESTMIPSLSWWTVSVLEPSDDPRYIYSCENAQVQSRGVVQYLTERYPKIPLPAVSSTIPTRTPTVAPSSLIVPDSRDDGSSDNDSPMVNVTLEDDSTLDGDSPTITNSVDESEAPSPSPSLAPSLAGPPFDVTYFAGLWSGIGDDVTGTGFGTAVSVDDSGSMMALGSPMAVKGGRSNASVYRWGSSGKWELVGQILEGDAMGNGFGQSVALCGDGKTIAVGAHRHNLGSGKVRVFHLVDEQWKPLGNDIEGLFEEDSFGVSVDISTSGRVVAVGAHGFDAPIEGAVQGEDVDNDEDDDETDRSTIRNAGQVRVFVFDDESQIWHQLGAAMVGTGENDNFGFFTSVAITDDGIPVVAAGARGIDGDTNESGHVRVYWFKDGEWQPMGQPLVTDSYDAGTSRVSLSSNGQRIVTGSIWRAEKAGEVCVYQYNANDDMWYLLGHPLNGDQADDWLGVSVDISDDGKTIAAGAVFHSNQNQTNVGQINVYRYIENQQRWLQLGSGIGGIQDSDYWGRSVSLSANGEVMAGGAYWFNPLSQRGNDGRVRVMNWAFD